MRFFSLLLISLVCAFGSGELSGRRAPGFSLPDASLKQYDLQDYRGKVVLIDFMQVDCLHCQTFSAVLEQAKAKYGDKIAILSIVNPPSDKKGVDDFTARYKVKSPILLDCGQVSYSYLKPTGNQISIPHVFLVDAAGMIQNDFGFSEASKNLFESKGLFAELDKVLSGKK
jgi:peroxiredoxin